MHILSSLALILALFFSEITATENPSSAKVALTQLFSEADIQINGTRPQDIRVHNERFYDRVFAEGSLGFGESYMDGWWDSNSLDSTISHIVRIDFSKQIAPNFTTAWTYARAYLFNLQDKIGSRKVIDTHYNLGNDLYQNMLDPLMAYSCGYWKRASSLSDAQKAKFDILCKKLKLEAGMTVLDIGCGWGGFEKYAAENYGVKVVGITLSENQAQLAKQVCSSLPVEIRVQDYRDVDEKFDRIVSIGMFEHVGSKNYRSFMEICNNLLKDNGIFVLHTIGSNTPTVCTDPWIHTYIFPNGQIPSISQIATAFEGLFVMEDWHNFGADYDKTLIAWFNNFHASWPLLKSRYDERFYRMWKYYLLSCAGAFRTRTLQLWQIVLTKEGFPGGYDSIR